MVDCHRERFPQHFQEHALGDLQEHQGVFQVHASDALSDQDLTDMSDIVPEESSMFGACNLWSSFLNLFNQFELDDLAREVCDELSGIRTSAT